MPPTPGIIASLLPADLSAIALAIFLVGTFVAAFVTGLSGFAFGMVAAAIWLHALDPLQGSTLIVAYALMVQGYAVWKLRRSIMPGRLAPFVIGTAVGLPAGLAALNWVPPLYLRIGIGALMIAFSLYNLLRPSVPLVKLKPPGIATAPLRSSSPPASVTGALRVEDPPMVIVPPPMEIGV